MLNSGSRGKRAKDGTGILSVGEHFNQQTYLIPTVTGFQVTDISYNPLDDTAANTAGSQTIVINGYGFAPGATVMVGTTVIGSVTWLDSNRLTFTSPALSSGVYTIYVTNANGGTGILVQGLTYSGTPTFSVPAGSVGSYYETTAISTSVAATGDSPINYSIVSGSLPSGATLNSTTGAITGTAPVDGSSTTYTFQVKAGDAQFQESYATFTLTINTDVVTFSSPANNTTYTVIQNSPISNVTIAGVSAAGYGLLYTTSGLPTGLSMNTSTGIISGTPTVAPATNVAIITATANTTNRIGTLYLNWTVNLPGDLFWNYASLLLSANTTPNGNTFNTDLSTYNNEVVAVGDTKPRKFNPFVEGYYSNYFDGTGDYLNLPAGSTTFTFGTGDFTVEYWVYFVTIPASYNHVAGTSTTSNGFGFGLSGTPRMYITTSTNGYESTNTTIVPGRWYHMAYTRQSGTLRMFLNGTLEYTIANLTTDITETGGRIGTAPGGSYPITAYISNLRVVKGTALYTGAYTPSTVPLTNVANTSFLICQSSKLIDNSNNNITLTRNGDTTVNSFNPFNGLPTTVTVPDANNYSVYFDGTGDYLSFSSNSAFGFGTGDFTVEYWVYSISWSTAPTVVDLRTPSGSSLQWSDNFSTGGAPGMYYNATQVLTSSITIPLRTWAHVAYTRQGSTVKVWVNGVQGATGTSSFNLQSSGGFSIGTNNGNANPFNGYVSNIRILKGTALYTTAFTPPAGPLTVIANTSLLTAQSNTVIDKSDNQITFTVNGNAGPARNGPFANTTTITLTGREGSAYVDGSGDYLEIAHANSQWIRASTDFTIECWFNYIGPTGGERTIIGKGHQGSPVYGQFTLVLTSTNMLNFLASTSGGAWEINIADTVAVANNTWNHVAVCRSGSTVTMYKNGAVVGTPATNSGALYQHTAPIRIGQHMSGSNFTGYISNARIVNGTAVYRTPFVPSWEPLTTVANTILLTAQTNLSSNTKVVIDESSNNAIITGIGNANLGTFSPFGSTWSVYFDGANDYLSMPTSSSFNFGTGDFTVECWVYWNSTAIDRGLISRYEGASSGWALRYDTNGLNWINGDTTILAAAHTPVGGTWYHYAACRSGSTLRLFINGTQSANTTYSGNQDNSSSLYIGQLSSTLWPVNGYISNVRILKGTALYTATFTPSTTPLVPVANTVLLTCNSNRFVDYSAANNVITRTGDVAVSKFSPFSPIPVTSASYSGYFDGTGDYLTVPSNAALTIGTSSATVEFWIYPTAVDGYRRVISSTNSTFTSGTFCLRYNNSSTFALVTSVTTITFSTIPPVNTWSHVAWVGVNGSSQTLYLNGVSVGTGGSYNYTEAIQYIGGYYNVGPAEFMVGYMSNVRVLKGTAVYTGAFTPSTTPLTAISDTSLLTCQSTTFIDNSANTFAITVNGDAKPVIQNPFTNTVGVASSYSGNTFGNSIYFDGTTDYLSMSAVGNPLDWPTSANYTIEAWVYLNAFTATESSCILARRNPTTTSTDWQFQISTTGALVLYNFNGSTTITATSNMAIKQWNHCAAVISGGTATLYLNGVKVSTATAISAASTASVSTYIVGASNSVYLNGYISNLRVVKSQALYTGPFIPSNQPLPPTSNTVLLLASTSGPSVTDATRNHNIETFGTARRVANNSPYYDTYGWTFDGASSYISNTTSEAIFFGTGDYTVEFWLHYTGALNALNRVPIRNNNTTGAFQVYTAGSGALYYGGVGVFENIIIPASGMLPGVWYHVAISRTSGVVSVYNNGVRYSTYNDTNNMTSGGISIGGSPNAGYMWQGHLSNMRIIKGQGIYSGTTITVPNQPLTRTGYGTTSQNITGSVSLLACQSNRFIDNSANNVTLTLNSGPKVTAIQPFAANNTSRFTSVYFGTKTDYLGVRPQPSLITFPGDFTFECWVYPTDTTLSTVWGIWDSRQSGATAVATVFSLNALASPVTGSWRMSYYNGTNYYGTGTVIWNQWSHLAWVRSGSTMTFYVNGVAGGTATISGTQTATVTTNPIYIGTKDNGLANYGTVGYIADLRITNGYARTITVPTAPYDIK